MRLRVLTHGAEPIRCEPTGCCRWIARTSVATARRRLYESSRGALPTSAVIEGVCGDRCCVNLDHLRVVRPAVRKRAAPSAPLCQRGHEVTAQNVVRHRDGRIAYCRLCRNERRRERYRSDPDFARREIARQRSLRRRRP